MTTETEVRFIAFTEEGRENVEAVFKVATEKSVNCTWVSPQNAIDITELKEGVAYVVDPIEGEEASPIVKHLVDLKYPVIGPQCALTVLKHGIRLQEDLTYPVYTLTMLNTLICFSNIVSEEREKLVRLVHMMGGRVSGPLQSDVTHLVVGEVGSVKYFTASSFKIRILVKDWINHLWKNGASRYINAKDGKWEDFLCPIFLGCYVCVTGFSTPEKNRIQKLVTKFGGEYNGAMKLNYTTHLVVNKPEGQKFAMAGKFGVKVVNVNWVYDSVEKGACQDNNKYPVKTEGYTKSINQSTPESHASTKRIESMDMSCIDPSMVNETVASTMNDTSRMSSIGLPSSHSLLQPPSNISMTNDSLKQNLLSFPVNKDYGDILDGIHVYLVGFIANEEEKMKQLLSLAGAIKYSKLTSSVSHVIVGSPNRMSNHIKAEIISANEENPELCVLKYTWVLQSLDNGGIVAEKDYWEKDVLPLPPSQNIDGEQTSRTTSESHTTTFEQQTTVKKKMERNSTKQDLDGSIMGFLAHAATLDDEEMLSQYINPQPDNTREPSHPVEETMAESTFMRRNLRESGANECSTADVDETNNPNETEMEASTMLTEATMNDCFNGKTFLVLGFAGDEMEQIISDIENNGGRVLSVNSKAVADFAVVPLTGWPVDRTVQDVVTNFWLDLCTSNNTLVSPDEHVMCTPFSVPPDIQPLRGCVTCLSKYRDSERIFLSRLIQELGGLDQAVVARSEVQGNKKTTHLIIKEPGGEKYTGCKNWGIPTITEEWVYECARKCRRLKEDDFSVDKPRKSTTTESESKTSVHLSYREQSSSNVKSTSVLKVAAPKVKQSSYANWNTEFPPMPRPPSVVDKIRKRIEAKADAAQKAKEEAIKNKETPLRVRYKRLQLETPSKFMTKGAPPANVSFDLTEVFELLKTPQEQQKKIREEIKNNPETPMSEFITRCLDEAVANIPPHLVQNLERKLDKTLNGSESGTETVTENETTEDEETPLMIFENLVISLAKKLHGQFADFSHSVTRHGGEFRWTYDNACTHLVFQGKLNDKNKEFCSAKRDGKFIVSPHWVNACVQTSSRLEESLFPHVYDPNKSIQMSISSPPKTRRRTLRNSTTSCNGSSSRSGTSSASAESEEDTAFSKKPRMKQDQEKEVEDSQEARDKLKMKLEHIMSSTKGLKDKQMHRLSCSRTNSPSPSVAAVQRRVSGTGTPIPMKNMDADKTELSQDVQVSWDDPTGREEMERLMRESKHDDSSFKVPNEVLEHEKSSLDDADATTNTKADMTDLEEHDDPNIPDFVRNGVTPHFIVSSVPANEKADYAAVIDNLGGVFMDSGFLDPQVTHLLVSKPARSEKFLSALASGKWVLHASYISACKEANAFLKEDQFEYGNPLNKDTEKLKGKTEDLQAQMSLAAHRWRTKMRENGSQGAFAGWKVLLHLNDRQLKGFERLLKSGSAEVVATHLPYHGKPGDITHAFIDLDKSKHLDSSYIEEMVSRTGIHICTPNYIGDYLIKHPAPDPHAHYLPQVTAILEKMDQENNGRETKRRKLD